MIRWKKSRPIKIILEILKYYLFLERAKGLKNQLVKIATLDNFF
jgi:hypothetical protein